jgi:RNA-directed DNA polymerase
MVLIRQRITDGKLLALIEAFLQQGVMESGRGWQPTTKGTPQGAVLSPLLANIYSLCRNSGIRLNLFSERFTSAA